MPIQLTDIRRYLCTKCTFSTYSEDAIRVHILDAFCKQGATSYHERTVE